MLYRKLKTLAVSVPFPFHFQISKSLSPRRDFLFASSVSLSLPLLPLFLQITLSSLLLSSSWLFFSPNNDFPSPLSRPDEKRNCKSLRRSLRYRCSKGNHDWISRFMVFTSGVCWIAGTWSPELASTAARELSS
ncbi:hypothetical protein DVH24_014181 [Malus domestica]|uniref:Transmembrane protein n=1 Tax=Malus domestica TaxID=3750 RepID=A0A498JFI3_MALDO|nr:hypothetical protein DVH24_014181 [Malus domestica]